MHYKRFQYMWPRAFAAKPRRVRRISGLVGRSSCGVAGRALLLLVLACTSDNGCEAGNPLMPTCVSGLDEPRLVFLSNRDWPGREDLRDVYTMSSRGTHLRRLTTSGIAIAELVRWSPDGQHIAYTEFDPPRTSLIVMAADGSNPVNISNDNAVADGYPAWSPDGRRIAFMSNRHNLQGGAQRSIYVMDSDGSNVIRLTTNNAWNDRAPHWSPDGSRIAFMSNRTGGLMQIFVMNADGSDQRQLTTVGINQWPNWSPDGTKISFASLRTTNGEPDNGIYVMNADGSGQTNLTKGGTMFDMYSTWSSDGRDIYFCSERSGMHIMSVGVADGVVRPVTNPANMSMEMRPNAKWPPSLAAAAR